MSVKFYIYILVIPIVIIAMDSINITQIFKKNQNLKANLFYFILGLSFIYIITNFIYDFFLCTQI